MSHIIINNEIHGISINCRHFKLVCMNPVKLRKNICVYFDFYPGKEGACQRTTQVLQESKEQRPTVTAHYFYSCRHDRTYWTLSRSRRWVEDLMMVRS